MTPEEIKKQEEAFAELKGVVESGMKDSAEGKEKLDKINTAMDVMEDANQKMVTGMQEAKKATDELEANYKALELAVSMMPSGSKKDEKSQELKAFEKMAVGADMGAEEVKYLRTDIGPDGGFLVPTEMDSSIIKAITEVSPMRQVARVRTIGTKSMEFPKRTGLANGGWVGEGGTASEDESTYGEEEIYAEKLMVYSIITTEMLQDSAFNMESEINMDVAEDFAQLEGAAFISGNGVKKPYGFLNDSNISSSNSGVADNITADSLIDITGELKVGYNAVYLMNRKTLADIRQLKDGAGGYLWASGLAAGQPNTINGESYASMVDMPDIGAGLVPVAYGDFSKGYYIVDRVGMSMIRDDVTLATTGKVRFIFNRRVGGKVVLPEAIKTITCAV